MKRSLHISVPLVAATAVALLSGCRRPEMQRCVDEQNHVVPESFCQANGVPQQPVGAGYGGGGGYRGGGFIPVPLYRHYYGGGGSWDPGSTVFGGSYNSLGGHSYTTNSAVPHAGSSSSSRAGSSTTRGGFGGTHGGGGE